MLTYGEIYAPHKTQDIHEHILASLSSPHEIRKPRSKVPSQRSRVHDKVVGPPNKLQQTNYNKQLPRRHQSQRTAYHKQLLINDDTTCDGIVSKSATKRKQHSIIYISHVTGLRKSCVLIIDLQTNAIVAIVLQKPTTSPNVSQHKSQTFSLTHKYFQHVATCTSKHSLAKCLGSKDIDLTNT